MTGATGRTLDTAGAVGKDRRGEHAGAPLCERPYMSVSFFDAFTPQEVARISAAGTAVKVPQGWSPIWESTPADKAYILLDGTVSVRVKGEEVAQLGAGEIIGEAAIVNHSLRSASIVALTPLELIHFTDDAVRRMCDEVPHFRDAIRDAADAHLGKR